MLPIVIFASMLSMSVRSPVIYCAAQQTFAIRNARNHQRGRAYAKDQFNANDEVATLNDTTLLQHLPSHKYNPSASEKNNRPHYPLLRATPPEVANYRNLGNYYQDIPANVPLTMLAPPIPTFKKEHKRHLEHSTPVSFHHLVLHLNGKFAMDSRPRRYVNTSSIAIQTPNPLNDVNEQLTDTEVRETLPAQGALQRNGEYEKQKGYPATIKKAYHDIFMRYNQPHQLSFGHVEFKPQKHFEKRFESLNKINGNRHRGEIIWADATGGYGEHHWDLAQGKLR
ncbi:uncharacterized protein LOC128860744 [Anastrepha ludens]|uniref:uncharacterized protein LOC128860744 n=1 Tax=Anastrepha ludens TaxID=28586 RepID=UPI0023AF1FBD|nr:uncharacterized protein LOC128860744 [Anastrepha ludens]